YYGTGSYDFSERVLNQFARDLPPAQVDQTIGVLRLNAEFYPNSGVIQFLLGESFRQKNDTASALQSYRQAVALDSTLAPARQRIAELTRR
ncbi:MAG: hypothetical protein HYS40_03280, partial [Gemmatimonadetes bacterium]|nr:hypothetical protein [Gemmatimonadota bacterium]